VPVVTATDGVRLAGPRRRVLGPGCSGADQRDDAPRRSRAPEEHSYAWTENPLGINGCYLVSRGGRTPGRMKLRTASFNNVQVLPELMRGTCSPT